MSGDSRIQILYYMKLKLCFLSDNNLIIVITAISANSVGELELTALLAA